MVRALHDPDFIDPIDLQIGLPAALNVRDQPLIALGAGGQQSRMSLPGSMQAVTGRGDLQHAADRLGVYVRRWWVGLAAVDSTDDLRTDARQLDETLT